MWGGGAVKALVRLSAWVAASKRWCLIDCTICRPTRHFMSRPIFFTKQPSYYRKVVPLIYNWASTRRFGIYLRCVQLFFKTCMDMNLVWLEVLMLAYTFIYTHSLCVCVCVWAVNALTRLPACAATSKHWRLIDYTISTNNLISWPIFTKKPSYYWKVLPLS